MIKKLVVLISILVLCSSALANLPVKDGAGSTKYLSGAGTGTNADPHIPYTHLNNTDILALQTANVQNNATVPLYVNKTAGLTDAQLRATAVPISGSVTVSNGGVAAVYVRPGTDAVFPVSGTVSSSLGKAEDSAHSSGDPGSMPLAVRQDSASALAANGDYIPLSVNSTGFLRTTSDIVTATFSGALSAGDNNIGNVDLASAIPAGTNLMGNVGIDQTTPGTTNGVVLNTGSNTIGKLAANNGVDIGNVDVTSLPSVSLTTGSASIGVLGANSGTDIGDVTLNAGTAVAGKFGIDQTTPGTTNGVVANSVVPGTGATNLGKAEDAAHSSGDVGVMAYAVRNDAKTALAGSSGDVIPLMTNSTGALVVTTDTGAAGAMTNTVLTDAHDNTNNSIRVVDIGASQKEIDSVMVAGSKAGTATNLTMDANSRLNVNTIGFEMQVASGVSSADSAANITISGVSGKKIHIKKYLVKASGAAVGASGALVTIAPPTGTTNLVKDQVPAAAVVGASIINDGNPDLWVGATNTNAILMMGAAGSGCILTGTVWYTVE